jgi:hypothetical protein
MQREFDEHSATINSLREQLHAYSNRRGADAARRYMQHLDATVASYTQLYAKFGEFKRPRDFEQRVARVQRLIGDVHSSVELLRPSAVNAIDSRSQLERCEVCIKT